jgi:hypothetical protein
MHADAQNLNASKMQALVHSSAFKRRRKFVWTYPKMHPAVNELVAALL